MNIQSGRLIVLFAGYLGSFIFSPVLAQTLNQNWTQPQRLADEGWTGDVVDMEVDNEGQTHVMWIEYFDPLFQDSTPESHSNIQYAVFDGEIWTRPITVRETAQDIMIGDLSISLDTDNVLHVVWTEGAYKDSGVGVRPCCGPVFYSRVPIQNATNPQEWLQPQEIQFPAFQIELVTDAVGVLHMGFSGIRADNGVYYSRSFDSGTSWSEPRILDPDRPADQRPEILQMDMDGDRGLHVVWSYSWMKYPPGGGASIQYAHSLDGGETWSAPLSLDSTGELPVENTLDNQLRLPYPGLAVFGETVHAIWAGGGTINVGRRHRYSLDRGETWSDTEQLFGDLHGQAVGDSLVFDSSGRLHFFGQLRWPQAIYHAIWERGVWSPPFMEYLIAQDHLDPIGDRIHAHGVRAILGENDQFTMTFTTSNLSDSSIYANTHILFEMHTRSPNLYYPHFGDGQGLATSFAVTNPTDQPSSSLLQFFDSMGSPQPLPFDGGPESEISLELAPKSTQSLKTLGTSPALRAGYAKIKQSQAGLSGMAIFKFASGPEASVLPTRPNRRFALFIEHSPEVDTGFAVLRFSKRPIELSLYDREGELVGSREYDFEGLQQARFITELFDVPMGFFGVLVLESTSDIAPVGLRFGDSVLSTIPVTDLDSPDLGDDLVFPQIGDGTGLSMLFSVSYLGPDQLGAGSLKFFGQDGSPMGLPFSDSTKSEITLDLESNATAVFTTTGQSDPLKKGYAGIVLDQQQTTAVAIFKFSSGLEASVLPTQPSKRFALFVERNAVLDTGLAFVRFSEEPITLRLYSANGALVAETDYDFQGRHDAKFLSELLEIPEEFEGLLIMQSNEEFAPTGLRFGKDVLSTIPVTEF